MRELREIYKDVAWEQHKLDLLFQRQREVEEDVQRCFARINELLKESSEHYNYTQVTK